MTVVFLKSPRVQPILVSSLGTPPPPVFYSEEITIEVLDEIEVTLCSED